jgi:serine/threonine protein kinase
VAVREEARRAVEAGRIVGGKYRLRRLIGEGGMGSVWAAVHEALDRTVAIKFLRPSDIDAETASARFVAEARSAAKVKHRFVVDVFDFGISEDGIYYMVQELLEGEELAACVGHGPAWEVRDAVKFIAECLSGLEAVHQAGIVHRDLKPENIFVIRDDSGRTPKLLDFGISKVQQPTGSTRVGARTGRQRQLTGQDATVGTPWYMSPEQLRGRKDLDGRADIYSVGVILYEWLTGRVPYQDENVAELSLQIASGSASALVTLRPELGHALSGIVAKALAPEPQERFASASELRDALLAVVPQLPVSTFTLVQRPLSAHPQAIGAATALLLQSARNPFADNDRGERLVSSLRRLRRSRLKPWMIVAAGGLALLAATVAILRSDTGSGHASAAEEQLGAARIVLKPQVTQLEKPPEPAVPAPPPLVEATAPTPAEPVLEAREPRDESRSSRRSSRRESKRGTRKVIRTLDF